jgi:dienelactone hydrolase
LLLCPSFSRLYRAKTNEILQKRQWASKPYVDPKRIGIWGWSYGGFMASKVLEMNEGIHSLGMSVAPVTSWLMYGTFIVSFPPKHEVEEADG